MLHLLAEPTGDPSWQWLTQAGSIGILAAAVIGFVRGWIVSGTQYREVQQQRDKALEQVFELAKISQRAIEAAERQVGP